MPRQTEKRWVGVGGLIVICSLAVVGCGTAVGSTGPSFGSSQALGQALVDAQVCDGLVAAQPPNTDPPSTDMTCRTATLDPLHIHTFGAATTVLLGQEVGSCAVLGPDWQVVAPSRALARDVQQAIGGKIGTCGS